MELRITIDAKMERLDRHMIISLLDSILGTLTYEHIIMSEEIEG